MSQSQVLARLYRDLALRQVPRILGLGDRRVGSPTYGCFDRTYWHYRLIDFPNAQQQQVSLFLALLYRTPSKYALKPSVRAWCEAAIEAWVRGQHADGSFDEAYPNERGYCATALSTAAVVQATQALGITPPKDALARAGGWLARQRLPPVSNQVAAAVLALLGCATLLEDRGLETAARTQLQALLALQDADGFFPEYGGSDVGYQSLTLSFLARTAKRYGFPELDPVLDRGARAVAANLDPLGRHRVSQNSRRTQFLYPYGLVIAGDWTSLERHRCGLESESVIEPGWLDDRYVIWLATDYLLAADALENPAGGAVLCA